jgi:transcriptional regulator with XRE-family HTH domain
LRVSLDTSDIDAYIERRQVTDTVTTKTTLGARIRLARLEAGFRNSESLAVRLGVGQRTIQRWETDKSEPSIGRLREIAALTGKTLAYFLAADGA